MTSVREVVEKELVNARGSLAYLMTKDQARQLAISIAVELAERGLTVVVDDEQK